MTTRSSDDLSVDSGENPSKKIKLDNESSTDVSKESTHYSAHNAGITEQDVGIREYISPSLTGFKGVLKQRYTDFLVNEIDREGNVVHLTDNGFEPEQPKEEVKEIETPKEEEKPVEKKEEFKLDPDMREKLTKTLDEEIVDKMVELLTLGTKIETTKSIDSKEDRTAIHQLVRQAFNGRLETKTTPENTFIITLSSGSNNQNKNRKRNRFKKQLANANAGPVKAYVHFSIYKENKETMQVAHMLSKFLRIPPKNIQYAGTKDRRGVTVQRASVGRMDLARLANLNNVLRGITLGGFKYQDEPLKLGQLNGNEFVITVRDIDETNKESIDKTLTSLKENGFINYYGMQRFGTFSVSTHQVGAEILKSDWKTVVELILSPQELVVPESVEARKIWHETRDAGKALDSMPRKCVAECAILGVLKSVPNSYLNAIMQIPRNLRMMYGHAYQSYVWNMVASERVKRFGLKPMIGDLVIMEQSSESVEEDEDFEDTKQETFVRARPVTQEEIDSGAKTIFDIVIPTPGFDILYPENELKQIYIDVMKKDGLDPDNMRRNLREFSLAGSYRHLISKPNAVEWWIRKYEASDEQMVKTDLELLNEKLKEEDRIITEGEGSKTALILKLQLSTSQYATMALREVMKVDTTRRGDGFDVQLKKD